MARMDAFGPVLKTKDVSKHSTSSQFYLLHWFSEICLIFAHLCCSNVPLSWVEFMYMALIVIYIYIRTCPKQMLREKHPSSCAELQKHQTEQLPATPKYTDHHFCEPPPCTHAQGAGQWWAPCRNCPIMVASEAERYRKVETNRGKYIYWRRVCTNAREHLIG